MEIAAATVHALRCFQNQGNVGKVRVVEEVGEAELADHPFTDAFVAGITARPGAFRIVGITVAVGYDCWTDIQAVLVGRLLAQSRGGTRRSARSTKTERCAHLWQCFEYPCLTPTSTMAVRTCAAAL